MMNIAICEDNPIHTQMIENTVKAHFKNSVEIVHFSSATELLFAFSEADFSCQIALLDIELEGDALSGIDLAKHLNQLNRQCQIIFLSQYLEYAPDVYETKHLYFVYKQKMKEYLPKALHAAQKKLHAIQKQFLYFKSGKKKYQISQNDILYMERILTTTEIHTATEVYTTREQIPSLMEQLPSSFCRCHRSYAVNLHAINTFTRMEITFPDGQSVPVGRTYYENAKKHFAKLALENQRPANNSHHGGAS